MPVLAVCLALVGCDGFRSPVYESSSFALYGNNALRAGIAYHVLEASSQEQPKGVRLRTKRPTFECEDLWAGAKQCSIKVDPGDMVAIVDSNSRVVRITILTDVNMQPPNYTGYHGGTYSNYVESMRRSWDSIATERATAPNSWQAEYRWTDPNGKWTAALWYSSITTFLKEPAFRTALRDTLAPLPDSIAVTHDSAWVALMRSKPAPPPMEVEADEPEAPPIRTAAEAMSIVGEELLELASMQHRHRDNHGRFAAQLADLGYEPRDSVTIEMKFLGHGWTATGSWHEMPRFTCVIFGGTIARPPRTRRENLGAPSNYPACDSGF